MAMWPAQFCPLINTFQESPPENLIRSEMDVGPAKVRRRTTANVRPVSFGMFLSKADVVILDAFYVTDTASGSEVFDFTHPRTGVQVQARFQEPPQYQNQSKGYNVSISLEIMP